jgi:hypothetical protein
LTLDGAYAIIKAIFKVKITGIFTREFKVIINIYGEVARHEAR